MLRGKFGIWRTTPWRGIIILFVRREKPRWVNHWNAAFDDDYNNNHNNTSCRCCVRVTFLRTTSLFLLRMCTRPSIMSVGRLHCRVPNLAVRKWTLFVFSPSKHIIYIKYILPRSVVQYLTLYYVNRTEAHGLYNASLYLRHTFSKRSHKFKRNKSTSKYSVVAVTENQTTIISFHVLLIWISKRQIFTNM